MAGSLSGEDEAKDGSTVDTTSSSDLQQAFGGERVTEPGAGHVQAQVGQRAGLQGGVRVSPRNLFAQSSRGTQREGLSSSSDTSCSSCCSGISAWICASFCPL